MGKYQWNDRNTSISKQRQTVHPIWRGIGCLLLILIPILAYAGAVILVEQNKAQSWLKLPGDFTQAVAVPGIGPVSHLVANLIAAVLLSLLGFALVTVVYAIVYRLVGPPRYGPLDAPPVRRS